MNKKIKQILIIILVIFAICCVYLFKQKKAKENNNEVNIGNKNISVEEQISTKLKNGLITMIDFSSDNCPVCVEMESDIKKIQTNYSLKSNIIIVDVNNHNELANKYKIEYTPTQIFFNNNGEAIYRHVGYLSSEDMAKELDKIGKI